MWSYKKTKHDVEKKKTTCLADIYLFVGEPSAHLIVTTTQQSDRGGGIALHQETANGHVQVIRQTAPVHRQGLE